jgi:hypothetical protein
LCQSSLRYALTNNQAEITTFLSFNAFELCCGIYFPAIGSLKSNVIPEASRSTIMNFFRLPLNLIVAFVLLQADFLSDVKGFYACAILSVLSACVAYGNCQKVGMEPLPTEEKEDAIKHQD